MASGGEKTEKATPKKKAEARKKGQVAKSQDLNGAVVLIAALMSLSALGPAAWGHMQDAMYGALALIATPDVVSEQGVGPVLASEMPDAELSFGPIAVV